MRPIPASTALLALAIAAQPTLALPQPAAAPAARQYDPNYEPRTDPRSPEYDPAYDPRTDPDHPAKSAKDPGEAWDTPRRGDGTPAIRRSEGDWAWGELTYGRVYKTKLAITNECKTTETVTLTVENLPYLAAPTSVTIPGRSTREVELTITTPPPPSMPLLTGHEKMPPGGIFVDITGETEALKVWHPWSGLCLPKRETYKVSGHIHFADADPDRGPERIASPSACQVWWNTGQRPRRGAEDCTDELRTLALHYRERILQGFAARDPEAWAWLPASPRIREMTAEMIFAFKQRADALTRNS